MMKLSLPSLLITISMIGCQTDKTIQTVNSAPTALITSPQDGEDSLEGYSIEFRGQVEDTNHSFDELEVAWFYGEDEACPWAPPDSGGGTFCHIIPTLDADTISLEVRDLDGAGGVDTVSIQVQPTENPEAEILSPISGQNYYSSQLITFEGTASDAEDDAETLSIRWSSSLDGELDIPAVPDGNGEFAGATHLTEGEHFIELTVTDQTGKTDADNITISVGPPNSAPTCSIEAPPLGSAGAQGDQVLFQGTVDDVDISEDDLLVEWFSDKDGSLGISPATSTGEVLFAYSDLSVDTHNITMVVTDELGESCTAATLYTVGTPPSVLINSPQNGDIFTQGSTISFDVTVSDDQDQPDDVSLTWTLDGQLYSEISATSTGEVQLSDSTLSYGSHTLSVLATDTDGLTASTQVSFTVNGIPSQPVVSISPTTPTTTDDLTVTIDTHSVDPEGVTPSYSYQWFRNGVLEAGATNPTLPASLTSKTESWSVQVTPSDGLTTGDFGEASTIIENTPPSLSSPSVSPSGIVYNDDVLTCSAIVTDPDETITPVYEWTVNGQNYSGASLNLSTTSAAPNDVVTCTITATDSSSASVSDSVSVTLDNRAPSFSSVSISPSGSVYNDSVLTCSGTVVDPDETLTPVYEWTVNGQTYSGASLNLSSISASPNDVVSCTATATDSSSVSVSDSASVTLDNRTPSINLISVNPSVLYSNSTATCAYSTTDADGDSLSETVNWFNGNTPIGSGSVINLTGLATRNDPIYCDVSVDDGSGALHQSSATIYITNTAPSAPTVMLSSTNDPDLPIAEEDDLICEVSPLPADIDGDLLYYTFDWTDPSGALVGGGGTPTTTPSDILSANTPTTEGSWTCSVSVSDGIATGGSDSGTIEVESGCPITGDGSSEDCPSLDCSKIYHDGFSTGDGVYWINIDGNQAAFQVYCDMDSHNEGWTQVGYEFSGDSETFVYLGLETGSPDTLAARTASGLIGERFTGYFEQVWIQWDTESIFFAPSKNIFEDTLERTIPVFDFSTTNSTLDTWVSDAGGAHFCRSSVSGGTTGGDTSWAVKPISDVNVYCGCNDGAWTGQGAYYSGSSNPTLCGANPGGFTGVKDNSQVKGHAVNYDSAIYVFRNYSDGDGDGSAAWEDCDDGDSNISSGCIPNNCHEEIYLGGSYWFCTDHVEWFEAQGICALNDGNLASVNDGSENAWLVATGENIYSTASGARWWIGLHDNNLEGSFEWISGDSFSYTNWNSSEPNNDYGAVGENCTTLMWGDTSSGWNDFPCSGVSTPQSFICEF